MIKFDLTTINSKPVVKVKHLFEDEVHSWVQSCIVLKKLVTNPAFVSF